MTSDDLGFLQAIAENPDDDDQRLIFADWLDDRGDRRGPFIRTQIKLATLAQNDSTREPLAAREREQFFGASEAYWRSMPVEIGRYFLMASPRFYRRGCLALVEVSSATLERFAADAETLFRYAPIEEIAFEPAWSSFSPLTKVCIRTLLTIPEMAQLRGLTLTGPFQSLEGVVKTVGTCRTLTHLQSLRFGNLAHFQNRAGLTVQQAEYLRMRFQKCVIQDGDWFVS